MVKDPEISRELGEITAKLNAMQSQQTRILTSIDKIDERMRHVEKKTFFNSAIVASIVAVSVNLIKDKMT